MEVLNPKRGRPKKVAQEPIKSDYMEVSDVASYLRMSVSHVYTLTSKREIPHIKLSGKKLLFDKSEIMEWLKSKKVSPK
jgi:excisionase family DNA binding protein